MSKEKKTLSIRELLIKKGFDPAADMIDLALTLKEDKDYIREKLEEIGNDALKADMLVKSIDLDKVRLSTLKALSDAKQKEDDQAIKLAQGGGDNSGKKIEYIIPKYKEITGEDGRVKLVKEDPQKANAETD